MDDMPNIDEDEADMETALTRIPSEPSEALKAAIREERARHPSIVTRVDEKAYREAVKSIIALGGCDPNAWAPPRRRFR